MTMPSQHRQPDRSPRRPDAPADHLHELAEIERLLRVDTRAEDTIVDVGQNGARIHYRTRPYNEHARGSLTASVANEIAATGAWGLSTIHDPHRNEKGWTNSMLTVVYVPEEAGE